MACHTASARDGIASRALPAAACPKAFGAPSIEINSGTAAAAASPHETRISATIARWSAGALRPSRWRSATRIDGSEDPTARRISAACQRRDATSAGSSAGSSSSSVDATWLTAETNASTTCGAAGAASGPSATRTRCAREATAASPRSQSSARSRATTRPAGRLSTRARTAPDAASPSPSSATSARQTEGPSGASRHCGAMNSSIPTSRLRYGRASARSRSATRRGTALGPNLAISS